MDEIEQTFIRQRSILQNKNIKLLLVEQTNLLIMKNKQNIKFNKIENFIKKDINNNNNSFNLVQQICLQPNSLSLIQFEQNAVINLDHEQMIEYKSIQIEPLLNYNLLNEPLVDHMNAANETKTSSTSTLAILNSKTFCIGK
jgi:hypothetical protein